MLCFTRPTFVALYQSAGSISFWLINVPFEVYYEPPGFNYYTITQSIPCHFIFMAFIMPLYVQLPNFILEEFHLISWVLYHSSHLSRLLFISVLCVCSLLWFFTSLTLCTYFFLLFLRCIVLLLLETAPQVFANFSPDGLFLGDLLCPLLSGCSI